MKLASPFALGGKMSLEGILRYSVRAGIFALIVVIIYVIIHKITKTKIRYFSVLAIFYLSALLQITVIRDGINFSGSRKPWQMEPWTWTVYQLRGGWWTFIYPLFGNIFWFIPMGIILGKRFGFLVTILLAGLISLSIETLQWLFKNGVSDIDDIIFNVTGAAIGYIFYYLLVKRKRKS